MGDKELIKDYSQCGIMLQTFAREAELEKITREHLDRMIAMRLPFNAKAGLQYKMSSIPSDSILLRTNITAEDLFALRIKRNKKHYKPKFTL